MANYQNNMYYGRQGSACNGGNNRSSCNCNMNTQRQFSGRSVSQPYGNADVRTSYGNGREQQSCGCRKKEDRLAGLPLAMAYVPWQSWGDLYDLCQGLQQGTIFEELDKPFRGRGGCNR